ncbi:MAG: CDC27 family protein [Nannocystaceae bacterium]|nr:CDC27 family protein [Nannocystaceae bacterium]
MARDAGPSLSGFESPDAEALYLEGLALYDSGEFEEALEKVEASLEIESTVGALYAKAQSLNTLGRCREAVPIYKEVLGLLPENAIARPAVKDALVTCAEKMAEDDAAVVTPPVVLGNGSGDESDIGGASDPVDDAPSRSGAKKWYADPYAPVLIGVGAIGVGIGGYYLAQASAENSKQPELYDEFAAKGERVRQLQVQGGVILGVGGALVLTGAIRYVILGVRARNEMAFTPLVGPRFTGASLSGRF